MKSESASGFDIAFHSAFGIVVKDVDWLSKRLVDITIETKAIFRPVHVRILLPQRTLLDKGSLDFSSAPVLFLLHGARVEPFCGTEYAAWTELGDAESLTAPYPFIVVMPDCGAGGFYMDWYNQGHEGPPMWETFHIAELLPWIDATLRNTPNASHQRVIAGLSMGGFGAMSYAARYPTLFCAAASFSGVLAISKDEIRNGGEFVFEVVEAAEGASPHSILPPFDSDQNSLLRWYGHDPYRLGENLRHTRLSVSSGNGKPGPFDDPKALIDDIEKAVHRCSALFHEQLIDLGIEHRYCDYGPGFHDWPYWNRELGQVLPLLESACQSPRQSPPEEFSYLSCDTAFSPFGWEVAIVAHRDYFGLFQLLDANKDGFVLKGAKRASITTPPLYLPDAPMHVRICEQSPTGRVIFERHVASDSSGRVTISIDDLSNGCQFGVVIGA